MIKQLNTVNQSTAEQVLTNFQSFNSAVILMTAENSLMSVQILQYSDISAVDQSVMKSILCVFTVNHWKMMTMMIKNKNEKWWWEMIKIY